MSESPKSFNNRAHQPGPTCLTFSRDGTQMYTGGADCLVRIWKTGEGAEQEPDTALDANERVTTLSAANDCWLSGSEDAEVRRYALAGSELDGLVTSTVSIAVRCVAVDPRGKRVAVTSDDVVVKVIDLEDTTRMTVLQGHIRGVRRATWDPSGSLLTTSGADGKIIVWNLSDSDYNAQVQQEAAIEGIIPAVHDTEAPDYSHDCSAIWHPTGQYFLASSKSHDIAQISRSSWEKTSTFSDDESAGTLTALAVSVNGLYLAGASRTGISVWNMHDHRVLWRFPTSATAFITQLCFAPTLNLLAWVDSEGVFTRLPEPIPSSSPSPVKAPPNNSTRTRAVEAKRKTDALALFNDDIQDDALPKETTANADDDAPMVDLDDDNWILDDLGGGMYDENEGGRTKHAHRDVKEMVSVTQAQPAFHPGSTPMANRKRYLAYNMIGVIEITDQDTHHIVEVEFHDRSSRKGYHFQDHFKYDMASLGERCAVFACQPENEHPAHVQCRPYGTWASQSDWTYELPKGQRVLGVAAGGPPPTRSMRELSDGDLQGSGFVVVATSAGDLTFLSGTGIELHCMGLDGDFVSMVAGAGWVIVVHRDGSTTMDGSQNLKCTMLSSEDFCILQEKRLPILKGQTLKWVGVTAEGAPAIYDSSGVLHIMPRFRVPLRAVWSRILDTQALDRREGKDESYWPVGVVENNFMCLILKGRQEHPGFPRPLIQELPLRVPFRRLDKDESAKEAHFEEHFARETMLLNITRDALGDQLTTEDISKRELALDKELVQLISSACRANKRPRALDLTKMLHHNASFDMAIKVAQFFHLPGLQEKMDALKRDREEEDRMEVARDKRRTMARDLAPIADVQMTRHADQTTSRTKAFQDFGPPPAVHRPGLARVAPTITEPDTLLARESISSVVPDGLSPGESKRKRSEDESLAATNETERKRRVMDAVPKANPFAKKPADGNRNPFARGVENNKSLHKSESFFDKVEAAETQGGPAKKPITKAKTKEKRQDKQQMTLPGFASSKKAQSRVNELQSTIIDPSQQPQSSATVVGSTQPKDVEEETQPLSDTLGASADVDETQDETQMDSQMETQIDSQVETQEETQETVAVDDSELMDWPDSPRRSSQPTMVA